MQLAYSTARADWAIIYRISLDSYLLQYYNNYSFKANSPSVNRSHSSAVSICEITLQEIDTS